MFEIYKDDEAFEVHRAAPSIAQWKNETAGMVLKVYGPLCTLVE
jgi:quinol monooxygenase YgiN